MFYVVVLVVASTASVTLCSRWRKSRVVSPRHMSPIIRRTSQRLPIEVVENIAGFLFEVRGPSGCRDGTSLICCIKPRWADVVGFMEASPELHRIGYIRWISVVTIRHSNDWRILAPVRHLVRELRCTDGVLDSVLHQTELEKFDHLYALSVDAHGDVTHDHGRFAYRDLFLSLPVSLCRLEITRAHGPDMKIITAVKECCPNLEELRLGRCTAFNSPEICAFWRAFPLDHDSYMSIEDTESYAHSLAQELAPLQSLQHLRLGLYLIPSTTVLAHRVYHRRNMTAPEVIEWQNAITAATLPDGAILDDADIASLPRPSTDQLSSILYQADPYEEFEVERMCERCVESLSQIGHHAETGANNILKQLLPNLVRVEWMAWLSPNHLGVNVYDL
ncbi:hypothetical protein FRC12_004288 [Ceratobasidium sp. 428]|nr:hypothetical protein FRC12_004288 [Ceratobasidium sp. 428]